MKDIQFIFKPGDIVTADGHTGRIIATNQIFFRNAEGKAIVACPSECTLVAMADTDWEPDDVLIEDLPR